MFIFEKITNLKCSKFKKQKRKQKTKQIRKAEKKKPKKPRNPEWEVSRTFPEPEKKKPVLGILILPNRGKWAGSKHRW
jgi:hypothetical protein